VTGARRPLRVLHVTAVETSNYFLNNLARFTSREDVQLLAVTLGRPGSFVTDLEALGVRSWAMTALGRWSYPRAVLRLWQLVRRESVDILHLHLFEPTVLGLVVAALAGRPAIVTRHHSDAVHRLPVGLKRSAYSALERWVEGGIAPDSLLASHSGPGVARTRPVCSHPKIAVYDGRGDINSASSYSCQERGLGWALNGRQSGD